MCNMDRTRVTPTATWAIGIIGTEELYTNLQTGVRRFLMTLTSV